MQSSHIGLQICIRRREASGRRSTESIPGRSEERRNRVLQVAACVHCHVQGAPGGGEGGWGRGRRRRRRRNRGGVRTRKGDEGGRGEAGGGQEGATTTTTTTTTIATTTTTTTTTPPAMLGAGARPLQGLLRLLQVRASLFKVAGARGLGARRMIARCPDLTPRPPPCLPPSSYRGDSLALWQPLRWLRIRRQGFGSCFVGFGWSLPNSTFSYPSSL